MSELNRIVVIGASAGGRAAITHLISTIPEDTDAAFLVVVHSSFDTPSTFHLVLDQKTPLKVIEAKNNLIIKPGVVYIACPNYHLTVDKERLQVIKGPRENLFRPAIDVLFRSVAVNYNNKVIGVLLTGRLNDGTSGLEAISKCGGITIIQDPDTAAYRDMPTYAKDRVTIDYILNLDEMGSKLSELIKKPIPESVEIPMHIVRENDIVSKIGSNISLEERLGSQVPISCPSCSGPLWKMKNSAIDRYRCHVGHSFTEEALLKSQNQSLEEVLWISLRTLEEKKMLLERLYGDYENSSKGALSRSYQDKIAEVSNHITKLREILQLHD